MIAATLPSVTLIRLLPRPPKNAQNPVVEL